MCRVRKGKFKNALLLLDWCRDAAPFLSKEPTHFSPSSQRVPVTLNIVNSPQCIFSSALWNHAYLCQTFRELNYRRQFFCIIFSFPLPHKYYSLTEWEYCNLHPALTCKMPSLMFQVELWVSHISLSLMYTLIPWSGARFYTVPVKLSINTYSSCAVSVQVTNLTSASPLRLSTVRTRPMMGQRAGWRR